VAPDVVSVPCRGNTSGPTSFLRHVGETPLARRRFCTMSGKRLWPDIVFAPCRGNTSGPTSFLCHLGRTFARAVVPRRRHEPRPTTISRHENTRRSHDRRAPLSFLFVNMGVDLVVFIFCDEGICFVLVFD